MFGYRRSSFRKATAILATIRDNPADTEALLDLQRLLIAEITLAEGRVRENKSRAKKESGARAQYFERRAQAHRQSIYYWKAFGDAIAFLYCDRFALKHVYYNTHNLNVRPDSGFISGSAGFQHEFEVLQSLLDAGMPSVLCDLTNTIRYGDVCLLADNDPTIVEVKSSRTKDRRRTRQTKNLKTLKQFYETDLSHGLRGFPVVHRVEMLNRPKSYGLELNQCIEESYERGYALRSPEVGICYIAASTKERPESIFEQVNLKEPWMISLNEAKRNQAWSPYRPFTMLIRSRSALYDFILGRLFVIVLFDLAVIEQLVREMGWTPEIDVESDYALRMHRNGGGEEAGISRHLLARTGFEALSLRWVVQESIRGFENGLDPNGRQ